MLNRVKQIKRGTFLLKWILAKYLEIIFQPNNTRVDIQYWEQRAKQYGRRSVLHLGHSEAEIETVTNLQKEQIFPILKSQLRGNEKLLLDFGCGTGRFTGDLAEIIQGQVIGADPIKALIHLAPKNENVSYKVIEKNIIPIKSNVIDVIWVCLVLGGITQSNLLHKVVLEMDRILKEDGLLLLVENTSVRKDAKHWKFRSVQEYKSLFSFIDLKHISDYFDLDESISIMAGRRCV